MFNNQKAANPKLETIIGAGTEIEGNLRTSESIRVDGKVKGEVHAETVMIGESGTVMGDVTAKHVNIAGKVKGNVMASVALELHPSGQVLGDIRSNKLIISDGATFEGNCQMLRSDGQVVELHGKNGNANGHGTALKVVGAKG